MILFLTALREEREAVREAWGLEPAGTLAGIELQQGSGCVHLCTGMGEQRVVAGLELGCRIFRPTLAVLVGFSVGLLSGLEVGRVVVDERSDPGLLEIGFGSRTVVGKVATCGFLQTGSQKAAFAERYPDSPIADLETEAFLSSLPVGVRGLVVRSVSDEVGSDLPLDFSKLSDSRGFPNVKAIAWAVATRPYLIKPMMRLARDSKVAMRSLAEALVMSRPKLRVLAEP